MNDLNLFSKCKNTTNEKNDQFVGIRYSEKDVTVFFPLGYCIPNDDESCRNSILTLLRTISLSKTIINQEVKLNDQLKEDYAFPISAYLWLIKDYFSNGIYKSKDKIVRKYNGGKINWKKTLQQEPIISNGTITYLEMYTEHTVVIDDIITEIHILCLNESLKHIGWLFGNFELKQSFLSLDNKEYLVNILNKTLLNANEDRKLSLLINLRNVLLGLDVVNDEKSINNYGVEGFEDVWQIVVARLFGNQDVTKLDPHADYRIVHEPKIQAKKSLRFDALLWHKKTDSYYIIDAKYYKFGENMSWNNAPETTDVEKQVVYGEYLDVKTNNKYNIFNSFVIPYNKYDNVNCDKYRNNIEFIGYATVSWKKYDENVEPYYYVTLIFVDCRFALDHWVYNEVTKYVDEIVTKILKVKPLLEKHGWTGLPIIY